MATEIRRPNGNGSNSELNRFGDISNYLCVDETIADDDNTYVYIEDDGDYEDDYTVPSTAIVAGSTINSVTVYARIKTGTIEYGDNQVGLIINGHGYFSDNLIDSNTGYTDVFNTWSINPETTSSWSVSDLNTFQLSMFLSFARCTQVWVSVDYDLPTTTSTSTSSSSSSSTSSTSSSSSTSSTSTSTSSTSTSTTSSSSSSSSTSTSTTSTSTTSTSTTSTSTSTTSTSSSTSTTTSTSTTMTVAYEFKVIRG